MTRVSVLVLLIITVAVSGVFAAGRPVYNDYGERIERQLQGPRMYVQNVAARVQFRTEQAVTAGRNIVNGTGALIKHGIDRTNYAIEQGTHAAGQIYRAAEQVIPEIGKRVATAVERTIDYTGERIEAHVRDRMDRFEERVSYRVEILREKTHGVVGTILNKVGLDLR